MEQSLDRRLLKKIMRRYFINTARLLLWRENQALEECFVALFFLFRLLSLFLLSPFLSLLPLLLFFFLLLSLFLS